MLFIIFVIYVLFVGDLGAKPELDGDEPHVVQHHAFQGNGNLSLENQICSYSIPYHHYLEVVLSRQGVVSCACLCCW
jgi:hypothetical protein